MRESSLDLFAEAFFQRALLGGAFIGLVAPVMGIFLVLRRLSMIGDTLAHVSIAGVALGLLINVYPLVIGLVFAILASFAIEKLRQTYRTYAELSIAIILSGGMAMAAIFFTMGRSFNINVMSYLFGSIVTLDKLDLWLMSAVTLLVIIVVVIHFKELFLMFFDEDAASVNGLPLKYYNILITMLTALVISVSIKIVGALLISALLTIPVACSLVLAKSFRHSLFLAIVFSEASILLGLSLAGLWDLAPGGTIVMLLIVFLLGTLFIKKGLKT